ncbi:MAG: hypothetical protein EB152_05585, partial [Euryarchaeota archaeon]|nr:hypothetical protein [Euryarchaeota archaeon]
TIDYYYQQAELLDGAMLQFEVDSSQLDILKELQATSIPADAVLRACIQFAKKHGSINVPSEQKNRWKQIKHTILAEATKS